MIVIQQIFENEDDYCTFLKTLAQSGYTRHHTAKCPRTRFGRRKGYVGFCEKYHGTFGDGWKIIIFMPASTTYNDRVVYYIRES